MSNDYNNTVFYQDILVSGVRVGTYGSADGTIVSNHTGGVDLSTFTGWTVIGYQALYAEGANNATAIGFRAMALQAGANNVAIGALAGESFTASQSVLIGYEAGKNATASNLIIIGSGAGKNIAGGGCLAIGYQSMPDAGATAGSNIAIGAGAMAAKTSGTNNTALGAGAGAGNIAGSDNVYIGANAGTLHTAGTSTFIGGWDGSGYEAQSAQLALSDGGGKLIVHFFTNVMTFQADDGVDIMGRVSSAGGTANYLQWNSSTTTPSIQALGSSTNIDIQLSPKGTGVVQFGTWIASADAPINGYVTIKDTGGTNRKLATIA